MAMSANEAIKTFYVRLIQEVPLDNTVFFAMAKAAGLFPLDTEDCIMAQDTNTKKVTYLLRHVVERGPDYYLPVLLQVMEDSGVSNVVKIANDIEAAMTGMKFPDQSQYTPHAVSYLVPRPSVTKVSKEYEDVKVLEDKLKERHIDRRYKSSQEDWFSEPEHFTSVALIHQKKHKTKRDIIKFANMHLRGDFSECDKVTTNIADLFAPVESIGRPYTLLIEGAPGIGKTILAKEIVFRWANGTLLKSERLVFLIYLRDPKTQTISTFESFINYISYSQISKNIEKFVSSVSGKGVTLVFDGYDEYPEGHRNNSYLSNVINHEVFELQSCNIIITSRPSASACLHNNIDLRVEILGFTKEHRKSYIVHSLNDNPNAIQDLLEYLECSHSVDAYCHVPLSMAILVFLFKESGYDKAELPTTQTAINYKFVCIIIRRFIKKFREEPLTISKFFEVPKPYKQILLEISKLAFKALQEDKIVFSASEISGICPGLLQDSKHWNGLDLLKAVQYFNLEENADELSFNFLHFSVQELLAAYHISLMSTSQQIRLLKETFWNSRYFNTWIMYVALTKDRPFAFKHFLSGNRLRISTKFSLWWSGNAIVNIAKNMKESKIKCLHLFQCFTEAGNDDVCRYVSNLLQDGTIDLSGQALSAVDLYTLSSFLARCVKRQWNMLDLSHCYLDDENFETFCKSYASLTKSVIYIDTINLSCNIFTKVSASQIGNLILSFNTKKLVLASNEIFDMGIDQATFGALLEHPNSIQSRFITIQDENQVNLVLYKRALNNSIASELFIMWYSTIKAYKNTCFYIENNSSFFEKLINTNSASIFKTILHSLVRKMALFSTDFKLHVKTINSTSEEVSSVIHSLASNVPLAVRMGENCLPLHLCNISSNVIGENGSFDRLGTIFFCSRFPAQTMYCMFYFLLSKTNLNRIYLNGIVLYDYSIYRFSGKSLTNHLELVYIYAHDITRTNVLANVLPQVISTTRSLRHLNLSACRFKIKHTTVILKALKQVAGLKTIAISDNNLSKVVCDILSSVIVCNRELQCIELSNCNLQSSEIKSITNALQNCKDLQSLDLSNNVITDDVVRNVAEVIEKCQLIRDLRLRSCQLHYSGIQEIAEAMVSKTSLCCIDLSNNAISNQNAMLINDFIINNTAIQKLNFSTCKLQSTGCQQLLQAMAKITSLIHLDLSNNSFTNVVVDNFTLMIHQNVSLEYLNISGCCDEVKDFEKITHSLVTLRSLNHLNLSCNVINTACADNIAIIITNNAFLEDFNLSRCAIGNSAFQKIIFALQNNHHLKYLYLKSNSKEGIATVISNNPFLENIDLSNCSLTEKEMTSILSSLRNHTSLKHFDISSNTITNHVVNDIVKVIDSNTQLTHLNISDTNIQEYGILKIFRTTRRINTLKSIKICNCTISDQAAQAIADAISVNCMVEELVFTNNDFHETGISMIFDALRNTYRVKCLTIASNDVISNVTTKVTEVVSNGHIAYFDLSNCHLQRSSCLSILDSLILQAPTLQHIDLSGNNLSGTAETIAQLISVSYYLQHVNLANTLMQDEEVMIIVKAMQNISSLLYVDLTSYSIYDELALEVVNAIGKCMAMISFKISKLCFKKIEATITTLDKNIFKVFIDLQQITICFSDCKNDIVDVAVSLINNSPNLQYLHLENCSLVEININNVIVALMRTTTLEYLCLVNFVIADRVDDRIATIIKNNIHLKNFKLASCKLTEEGLTRSFQSFDKIKLSHLVLSNMDHLIGHIVRQLKRPICNSLTHLNLSNIHLDLTKLSYLCLPYLTKLQYLDLSHNPLTDQSADTLSAIVFNNNDLKHLDLCDCKLQSEGIRIVAKPLQTISVVYLDMSLNTINIGTFKNDLMPALLYSVKVMKYLALPCCKLKQKEIDNLFGFIGKAICLKFIDVGPNVVSKGVSNLFKNIVFVSKEYKQISYNTGGIKQVSSINCDIENFYHSLNYLNISNIIVNDQIGNAVANLIANSPKLEDLDMAGGGWSSTNAMKCFKALQNNTHLIHFNFSNNSNNFNFTMREILYLLNGCSALKILNLENCCRLRNRKTVSVTTQNPTLIHLNYLDLNNNLIDDEAADYLAVLIAANVQLEYLNFCNCELSSSGMQNIYSALKVASSLKFLYINFDDTYVKGLDYGQVVTLLAANKHLEQLGLSDLVLDNAKLHQMLSHLCVIKGLRKLTMSDCNFTDEDTSTIISLIANNPTLREFALLNCEMSIRNKLKFSFIGAALDKQYLKLDTITIANPENMSNKYSLNANTPLHCNVLKLTMTDNDVVAVMTVDNKLGQLIMFKLIVNQDDLMILSTNSVTIRYLKIFHIQDCTFTDYYAHYVAFLIKTNAATIQNFSLTSCKLSTSQKAIISKALCKLDITLLLHLNIQEIMYTDVKNESNKILEYTNCKLNDNILAAVMTDHTNLIISKLLLNHETLSELERSVDLIKGVIHLTIDDYALDSENDESVAGSIIANNDCIQEFVLSNCSFPEKYLKRLFFVRTLNLTSFERVCFPKINEELLVFIITNNPGLNHFTMCMCEIAESELARIMHSIATVLRNLLHINFSHLKCSYEVANDITTVISCNTKLKHIDLCNCQLLTVDVKSIIQTAKIFTALEYFDLSCNDVTDYLVNDVATLIANNKNIKKLSLPDYTLCINNNYFKVVLNTVTDILVNDIATLVMATSKNIAELSLLNCYLSDDQCDVIRNAVKECSTPPCFDSITVNQMNWKWNLDL